MSIGKVAVLAGALIFAPGGVGGDEDSDDAGGAPVEAATATRIS
jgi:hypothetical protein